MKLNDGIEVFYLVLKRYWKSMENGFWKRVATLYESGRVAQAGGDGRRRPRVTLWKEHRKLV